MKLNLIKNEVIMENKYQDILSSRKICDNIYLEVFPLSGNPLKSINIFLIKTKNRNMIIDTGFNNPENQENMLNLIEKHNLDMSKTDLYLTHLHSDHVGLAQFLKTKGLDRIYLSKVDGDILKTGRTKNGIQWSLIQSNAKKQGLDVEGLSIEDHPGYKNRPDFVFDFIPVKENDLISIGRFNFKAIDFSGHTPGMLGLYDRENKILFCGDHILNKITPNITFWDERYGDSLGIYLSNLEKIKDLEIKYLLSSHRQLIDDVNLRIEEVKKHHELRLNETLDIVQKYGRLNVRELTKNLNWDIRAKNWDEFPKSQKWFAAGEAHAHLYHLYCKKILTRIIIDEVEYYELNVKRDF